MRANQQHCMILFVLVAISISFTVCDATVSIKTNDNAASEKLHLSEEKFGEKISSELQDYNLKKGTNNNCFRAAVVDYSRFDGAISCTSGAQRNLDVFEKIARISSENGAQILVLPEDGVFIGTREYVQPCLEEIPDPELVRDYNPCAQPNRFNNSYPILTRLSCLARENKIYLVANYGTKEEQKENEINSQSSNATRGVDGKYLMLNTDVVFDREGNFIRRYRKWNPFINEMFAKSPRLEHTYFDTDFGRFGVFTCFDMLFKEPAIELIEKYNVDTVLFPTWWFDELPVLTAVQYQDGWSYANGVNLLASNILKPSLGSIGSGIFSGNNSLYVAQELPTLSVGATRKTRILVSTLKTKRKKLMDNSCDEMNAKQKIIDLDDNPNSETYLHMNYPLQLGDVIAKLDKVEEGTKSVCTEKFCCIIEYKLNTTSDRDDALSSWRDQLDRLIIIVRDGLRQNMAYEQVCQLATLKVPYQVKEQSNNELDVHGRPNKLAVLLFDSKPAVSFEHLSVRATFSTKHVYPTCGHSLNQLVERKQRQMSCSKGEKDEDQVENKCKLTFIPNEPDAKSNRLYSFGMYARVYEKDNKL